MNTIHVTQYVLPHGRREEHELPVTESVAAYVAELNKQNKHIEMEILRDGTMSWTIADREEEEDVAMELCFNPTNEKSIASLEKMLDDYKEAAAKSAPLAVEDIPS